MEHVHDARKDHVGDLGVHHHLAELVEYAHLLPVADAALLRIERMQPYDRPRHELVQPRKVAQLRMGVVRRAAARVEDERIRLRKIGRADRAVHRLFIDVTSFEA